MSLYVSLSWSEDSHSDTDDEDDDDDDESGHRYDRKQNTRDADDLRKSLRQRLATNQFVLSFTCNLMSLALALLTASARGGQAFGHPLTTLPFVPISPPLSVCGTVK